MTLPLPISSGELDRLELWESLRVQVLDDLPNDVSIGNFFLVDEVLRVECLGYVGEVADEGGGVGSEDDGCERWVGGRGGEEEGRKDEGVDTEDLDVRGGGKSVDGVGGAFGKRRSFGFVGLPEGEVLEGRLDVAKEVVECEEGGGEREGWVLVVSNEELESELNEVREGSGGRREGGSKEIGNKVENQ